jgi:hypothetical protein
MPPTVDSQLNQSNIRVFYAQVERKMRSRLCTEAASKDRSICFQNSSQNERKTSHGSISCDKK